MAQIRLNCLKKIKCMICDSEVELAPFRFYGTCIEFRCPVCNSWYVGNLAVEISMDGLKVVGTFKGEVKLNLTEQAIPVYRRAFKEGWDTKKLLKELDKLRKS